MEDRAGGIWGWAPNLPGLGQRQEVAPQLHAGHQGHLQQQAAQHRHAEQGPWWPRLPQHQRRPGAAHEHSHGGGDDQVDDQELHVAQIGVDLPAAGGGQKEP